MSLPTAVAHMPRHLALAGCLPLLLLLAARPGLAADTAADGGPPPPAAAAQSGSPAILEPERREARQGTVLTVFFAFDRAELTPPARRALDQLAPRLRAHLAEGRHVLIEGHADARGPSGYNIALSERRARAVAGYLHAAWEIPLSRLNLRAWGEADLRRPDLPRHAENRRVEIALLQERAPIARGLSLRPGLGGHLDIDDFGGAPSPLPDPRDPITTPAPDPS